MSFGTPLPAAAQITAPLAHASCTLVRRGFVPPPPLMLKLMTRAFCRTAHAKAAATLPSVVGNTRIGRMRQPGATPLTSADPVSAAAITPATAVPCQVALCAVSSPGGVAVVGGRTFPGNFGLPSPGK